MQHYFRSKLIVVSSLLVILALCIGQFFSTRAILHAAGQSTLDLTHPASASQSDWTMFSFHHSRFNPNEHMLSPTNVSKLVLDWSKPTITPNLDYAATAVANGIAYTASDGPYSASVIAFNVKTGATIWSGAPKGLRLSSSPAVVNGVVYVSSAEVYALNAITGATLWSANIGAVTSPVVDNGIVYVGTNSNSLYALNAKTGAKLWSATTGGYINTISPSIANGIVYVGAYDNKLYAFNAKTGATVWTASTVGFIYTTPAVYNGMVYVLPGGQEMDAFNAMTGAKLWSVSLRVETFSSPAVANGMLYICSGDGRLFAYNASTGKKLWQASAFASLDYSPALANGVVYATFSNAAGLVAFDARTGKQLFSYFDSSASEGISSPTVADGMVYFNTNDSNVNALHLPGH